MCICDKVANQCKLNHRVDIHGQLLKYLQTISKTHRMQVKQLVDAYGASPMVHTYIRAQSSQALRRHILGIFAIRVSSAAEPHAYFGARDYSDQYNTEYRSTSDILYNNMMMKKRNQDQMQSYYADFIYRKLPPPYERMLWNARILNTDGFKDLAHTNNVDKAYLSMTEPVMDEATMSALLFRPVYILNEGRFMGFIKKTVKKSSHHSALGIENSVVMLTRPYYLSFDAVYHGAHLLTHQFPTALHCLFARESTVHLCVYHKQQAFPCVATKAIRQSDGRYSLECKGPSPKNDNKQPVRVSLDTKRHRVNHYEIIKHRVGERMKNMQFGQLPTSLQTKAVVQKNKCVHYIVLN